MTQQMHRNTQKTTLHNQSFCQQRKRNLPRPISSAKITCLFCCHAKRKKFKPSSWYGCRDPATRKSTSSTQLSHSSERRNSGFGFRNPIVTSQLVHTLTDECVCLEMCIFRFSVGTWRKKAQWSEWTLITSEKEECKTTQSFQAQFYGIFTSH